MKTLPTFDQIREKALAFADSRERGGCTAHQCLWRGYEEGMKNGLSLSSPVIKQEANTISDEEIKEMLFDFSSELTLVDGAKHEFVANEYAIKLRSLLSGEIKKEQGTIEPKKQLSEITDEGEPFGWIKNSYFELNDGSKKQKDFCCEMNYKPVYSRKETDVLTDDEKYKKAYSYVYSDMPKYSHDENAERLKCCMKGIEIGLSYFSKVEEQKKGE